MFAAFLHECEYLIDYLRDFILFRPTCLDINYSRFNFNYIFRAAFFADVWKFMLIISAFKVERDTSFPLSVLRLFRFRKYEAVWLIEKSHVIGGCEKGED